MRLLRNAPWRALAIWTGCLALAGAAFGALLLLTGAYSVAASSGHFAATRWLLEIAMRRSVETHARGVSVPDLGDEGLVRLGAAHFANGCADCHGAPGQPRTAVSRSMLPQPPVLQDAVPEWHPAELLWIVKHGLKYTGMPAWPAHGRDDEVAAVVAFLRRLPGMSEDEYLKLSSGHTDQNQLDASEIARGGGGADVAYVCARCHDTPGAPPVSAIVPRLAGQSRDYLEHALRAYARNERPSGIMQLVASELKPKQMADLAAFYARMTPSSDQPKDVDGPGEMSRGRKLAREGDAEAGVPRCLACHSGRASPMFPVLDGQPAEYVETQLALFAKGQRNQTSYGAIMTPIAERLTPADRRAVAAYFASLRLGDSASRMAADEPAASP